MQSISLSLNRGPCRIVQGLLPFVGSLPTQSSKGLPRPRLIRPPHTRLEQAPPIAFISAVGTAVGGISSSLPIKAHIHFYPDGVVTSMSICHQDSISNSLGPACWQTATLKLSSVYDSLCSACCRNCSFSKGEKELWSTVVAGSFDPSIAP